MTTKLSKPVTRLIEAEDLIVTLTPAGITVREKGRRFTYGPLSYQGLLLELGRRTAEATRREKARARALTRGLKKGGFLP